MIFIYFLVLNIIFVNNGRILFIYFILIIGLITLRTETLRKKQREKVNNNFKKGKMKGK